MFGNRRSFDPEAKGYVALWTAKVLARVNVTPKEYPESRGDHTEREREKKTRSQEQIISDICKGKVAYIS